MTRESNKKKYFFIQKSFKKSNFFLVFRPLKRFFAASLGNHIHLYCPLNLKYWQATIYYMCAAHWNLKYWPSNNILYLYCPLKPEILTRQPCIISILPTETKILTRQPYFICVLPTETWNIDQVTVYYICTANWNLKYWQATMYYICTAHWNLKYWPGNHVLYLYYPLKPKILTRQPYIISVLPTETWKGFFQSIRAK